MPQLIIDVAVAIIRDDQGRILVNERQANKEHAGHWEFPGGKFDDAESVSQALYRECKEELGIDVLEEQAFLEYTHAYPSKTVRLHVRLVSHYENEPESKESQKLAWMSLSELKSLKLLLAGDQAILMALEKIM